MFADEIGAEGYGADASSAVDLFLYLVGKGPAPKAVLRAGVKPTASAIAAARPANNVVRYQILYWRDLPSSIRAWDDFGEVKKDLPGKFAERIDATAQRLGLTSGDAYTAELKWGDEQERLGAPEDVVKAIIDELEAAAR
jgi:hypothetical protein